MVTDWGSAATDFPLDPERKHSSLCLLSVNGMNAGICHLDGQHGSRRTTS